MRLSIPGLPGVAYDTDTGTSAIGVAMTAAGRYAPKPKGYALQLLPYLWSFEVDLREVPTDHPIQYLHPEGTQSLASLPTTSSLQTASGDLEAVLRFVWAVNRKLEETTDELLGRGGTDHDVVIDIQDGAITVDDHELHTDTFDLERSPITETGSDPLADSFDGDEPAR